MAIKDYLKIEIKKELEDDPNYPKPEPKKRVVYKAYKLKK